MGIEQVAAVAGKSVSPVHLSVAGKVYSVFFGELNVLAFIAYRSVNTYVKWLYIETND